jgi:hypothetical protein
LEMLTRTAGLYKYGKQIENSKIQSQHENHVHITIPRGENDGK